MNHQLYCIAVHSLCPSDLLASHLSSLNPAKAYQGFWLVRIYKEMYLSRDSEIPTKVVGTKTIIDTHFLPIPLAILDFPLLQLALLLLKRLARCFTQTSYQRIPSFGLSCS